MGPQTTPRPSQVPPPRRSEPKRDALGLEQPDFDFDIDADTTVDVFVVAASELPFEIPVDVEGEEEAAPASVPPVPSHRPRSS